MINTKLIQDLRLVFFFIWLILMVYGFYKHYKNTDFKNISVLGFTLASLVFFWCGYITAAMIFGIEHLYLLPFMPFRMLLLARWCELNLIGVIGGCLIPPALLWGIHKLLAACSKKYLRLCLTLTIFLWTCLFCSGGASFLYVLSRFIF